MAGGLDHLVVVARDLGSQADFYRRLGFQVGAQNRHAWGTLNHIVQFDGCFLELLTTEEGFKRPTRDEAVARFTDPIVDYLAEREGLAMMVLEGFEAASDHEAFNAAGVGVAETFYFARQGRRPNGEPVEVAFSLAFAESQNITNAGFFVCQQHAPEMFWNPAFQVHENGATGIKRIVFAADNPRAHGTFFEAYTGVEADAVEGGLRLSLLRGAVDVLTPSACADVFGAGALPPLEAPGFAAIEFSVKDRAATVARLHAGGIALEERHDRAVVAADAAMGVTLAFSQAETAQ